MHLAYLKLRKMTVVLFLDKKLSISTIFKL